MKTSYRAIIGIFIIATVGGLIWFANHYYGKYLTEQKRADDAVMLAKQRQQTINEMSDRQREVAALDARYTKELADAQNTISDLRRDVDSGKRRLQLNAKCPANGATGSSSLGDASTPTITADAERDYWRLRDGINTVTGQVKYLQDYIRQQCLR